MTSHILNGRWVGAFLLIAVALCITPAVYVQAETAEDTDPNGPVFLILSLEEEFDTPADLTAKKAKGSATVLVEIGTFLRGVDLTDTRFKANASVKVKLPKKIKSFAKLNGYAFTILGSFDTNSANTIHLASPYDEDADGASEIPFGVEEAFFIASPYLTDEFINQFPTTVEIAQFIYDTATTEDPDLLTRHEDLTAQQILNHLFLTDPGTELGAPEDAAYAEAEGDMFPHDPGARLFKYEFEIDTDDGDLDVEMRIDVEIDIKPGNADNVINNEDEGVVWAAVLSTRKADGDERDFNATTDIDHNFPVYLGGSEAKDYKTEDVDHDGDDDVTFKFDVEDIGLDENTTEVTLTGRIKSTTHTSGFTGTDHVTVK